MNIDIIGKDCCGCSSCKQVCPKKCIKMESNNEGFLYPSVDENLCVNCTLCLKACPVYNKNKLDFNETNKIISSYIGYNKASDVRLSSSSGGIFDVLAKYILEKDGVVFGAMFDSNNYLKHSYITSYNEMPKLRGSKYLQSDIDNSYVLCKEFLDNGKLVLFSGVACQISGLKKFLKNDYDNLYTVDVLCHGVPSPKVFRRYLRELNFKDGSKVEFRNKETGWKNYSLTINGDNKNYTKSHHKDDYMKIFLGNLSLRESCFNCKFKDLNRDSDITIGDAWGIEKHSPELDDDKGASVIIIHSNRGMQLFKEIRDNLVFKSVDIDIALPKNSDSRKSVKRNKNKDKFFSEIDDGKKLSELVKYSDDKTLIHKLLRKGKKLLKKVIG